MRQRLDDDAPLLGLLFELAQRVNESGATLRVIGGVAMYFWHREHASAPRMTEDIDCAFPTFEWPTETEARPKIQALIGTLNELGLKRATGQKARASRTARFTYQRPGEQPRIELICGAVPFGKASRRAPAWRLIGATKDESFYASRLEWLDLVPTWMEVEVARGESAARLEIPSISGLLLLKLKAVADKLQRCDEETEPAKIAHEIGRLERHGEDLLTLFVWSRDTAGTYREYATARDGSADVPVVIDALRTAVLGDPPHERLRPLFERLREIVPDL